MKFVEILKEQICAQLVTCMGLLGLDVKCHTCNKEKQISIIM